MSGKLKDAFDQVQAETRLKENTKDFIFQKTKGYTLAGTRKYRHLVPAFACIAFLLFGGHWLYFTPTVEISIDINPSMELGINRFNRVISLTGYNEDGQELADSLDIQFMNYSDAVSEILKSEDITSLLSEDEVMTISVIGTDNAQSEEIYSGIQSCTAGNHNTYCYYAYPEDVEKAHEAGLSYGKYRAFLEVQELDPDITADEIRDLTMREIRDLIDQLSEEKESGTDSPANGYGSGRDLPENDGRQGEQHRWGRQ